jgi:hypothetical protein
MLNRYHRYLFHAPMPTLRIVTWNCAMAFRRTWPRLAALQPDIAVIQECEEPDKWPAIGASSILWHGENRHKGLAVLSFGGLAVRFNALCVSDGGFNPRRH